MTTITSGNIPSGRVEVGWEDMTVGLSFRFHRGIREQESAFEPLI
jgi:hypothetical protein